MIAKKGPAFGAVLIALTLSLSAWGAGQRRNQQQQQQIQQEVQRQQQQGQGQQAVGPQVKTKEEADAFNALQMEQNPAKRIELAEAFVAKFPDSDFIPFAHTFRLTAYSQLSKHKESIAAGEQAIDTTIKYGEKLIAKADADAKLSDKERDNIRKKDKNATFLDKNSPQFQAFMNQTDQRILAYYQSIIQSYQMLNDAAKMMEWGEKALGYKPDDIQTLAMLSNVMAERPPVNDEQKTKQMKRAEEIVNQALTLLPAFLSSPEAASIPAPQKTELTAQLHYTLGLVYLHQKRLGSSEQEFLTALKSKPNDPITYYRLGIAYVQDTKNDQAMDALGKSVFLKGVSEGNARDLLKQLYTQKNKSEQGIDDYIKTAGSKIGQ
jgi:tetratricopeptide (TPR) repeat protein